MISKADRVGTRLIDHLKFVWAIFRNFKQAPLGSLRWMWLDLGPGLGRLRPCMEAQALGRRPLRQAATIHQPALPAPTRYLCSGGRAG
jgi:hypothetical protein